MLSRVAAVLLVLGHLSAVALTFSIPGIDISSLSVFRNASLGLLNETLSDSRLPPDPYIFEIPNTQLTVEFLRYKGPLPRRAAEAAIRNAQDDAIYKPPSGVMRGRMRRYTDNQDAPRVNLKVTSRDMTWGDWNLVLNALNEFVDGWEALVLNFRVTDQDQPNRSMGWGYLEDADDDDDSDSDF